MKKFSLGRCDFCGGPAVWTFVDGLLFFHCEDRCDGFMQLELFEETGVGEASERDAYDGASGLKPISVALERTLRGLPF